MLRFRGNRGAHGKDRMDLTAEASSLMIRQSSSVSSTVVGFEHVRAVWALPVSLLSWDAGLIVSSCLI